MADNYNRSFNHRLILRLTGISLIFITIGTVVRPLLVDMSLAFTLLGIMNIVMFSFTYFVIRTERYPQWESLILLTATLVGVIPLLAISGGVNSQFSYLLPLFPIMAALFGGKQAALSVCVVLFFLVTLAAMNGQLISDFTDEPYHHQKTISRSFWLIISIVSSTYFGVFFQSRYYEVNQKLQQQATQDPMTGLLNRRGFNNEVSRQLDTVERENIPLSIVLIDIDFFKKINDKYGHDVGDICLKELAECLQKTIRRTDSAARFGGEEFILLLPNTDIEAAARLAEKVRLTVEQAIFNEKLRMTVTAGVAQYFPSEIIEQTTKRADVALYRGKESGRNKVEKEEKSTNQPS